jgi:putative membrane protein
VPATGRWLTSMNMETIGQILIGIVGLEHLFFLWLEMFAWETAGKKTFKNVPEELFKPTRVMAANQGLYNGFLAAGLIWTFFISDPVWKTNISVFFLICVIVAGIYGAFSVDKKIFFVQSLPGIIALILVLSARLV